VALPAYLDFRRQDRRCVVAPVSPLFLSNKGNRFTPNSLQQMFKRLYIRAGLEGASSYSERRTFATRLSGKGIDIQAVSRRRDPVQWL
jgi:integrase/recombinase XerD